ncbi:hypothetical protein CSUB01_02900 [Colletotrichum sublineola]|uniref:Uncharacterized protein n=1 Tax=Colletotrichum sublineola TaxID=1173701 RepID=A0A066X6E0_COLSU|nr:hypothetical protein CSUB01_02900 [Colletotrichum sublineola]
MPQLRTDKGESNVKVVLSQVPAGVRGLHDHLLPGHGPACEGEFVACAAPLGLGAPEDPHGRPPVREVVVDGPGRVTAAHVRAPPGVTPGASGAAVGERVVVAVAGRHGPGGQLGSLAGPGAGGLAAVPVAGRRARAGRLSCRGGEKGEKGQEG